MILDRNRTVYQRLHDHLVEALPVGADKETA